MRKFVLAAALTLAALPALASDLEPGTLLGTSEVTIRAALTELGWEVRKFATEDGMIEVYAVSGEAMAELYIDPTTGALVQISDEE